MIGRFLPTVFKHRVIVVFFFIFVAFSAILSTISPLLQKTFIDRGLTGKDMKLAVFLVILITVVGIFQAIITVSSNFLTSKLEQSVLKDIQTELFSHVLALPKSYFDDEQYGNILTKLSSDIMQLRGLLANTFMPILSAVFTFFLGVAAMFKVNAFLAAITLAPLPVFYFVIRFFGIRIKARSHRVMGSHSEAFHKMNESVENVSHIKAFGMENETAKDFERKAEEKKENAITRAALSSSSALVINIVIGLVHFLVLIFGVLLIFKSDFTIGSLIAFESYIAIVYTPVRTLSQLSINLQSSAASLERINTLYEIAPENVTEGKCAEKLHGNIEFKDVSFSYGKGADVLKNVSFSIASGSNVYLIGESGAGKTTILSLILCFYKPKQGSVLFDGISDYSISSLRSHIAYVSQNCHIISGTIMDNLKFGNQNADFDTVVKCTRLANIHDFIASLPNGYDTPIVNANTSFSQGQKQRFSIACALIKNADIIILDEPYSALDSVSETRIFHSIMDIWKDKTIITVTHRLSSITDNDDIIFAGHKNVCSGSHSTLINSNAEYARLFKEYYGNSVQ